MLTWIAGQISKLWTSFKSLRKQALSWAKSQASKAANAVKAWARREIGKIKATALSLLTSAKYYARRLVNDAKAWWSTEIGKVKATAVSLWTSAKYYARKLVNDAKAWWSTEIGKVKATVVSLWTSAKYYARDLINDVKAWWATEIGKVKATFLSLVTALKYWVRDLVESFIVLTPDYIARLISLLESWWATLAVFLADPLGFILSFLIAYLLPILEYALAYALDPHNPDMPPWPVWGTGGYGGVIYPGKGPPPGASGLAPPLDHIRVSGYTFRPGHPGIDLGLTVGTPVYAMHKAKVLYAGWDGRNFGYTVVLKGGEWWTRYAHLSRFTVTTGMYVRQSQTIGLGGSTGNSTGPHLHLEVKHNGNWIDPLTVL